MTSKPAYTEIERFGRSCQSRNGSKPNLWLLHTEEGNSSAESLAAYLNNPDHDASYHYTLRDGIVCDVVDTDLASWSVGNANGYSINLCFAGSRASWTRNQWLEREHDIAVAAWIAVQDCRKYGIPAVVIAPPYRRGSGISDHRYVTDVIGWGTHTDVGAGFPWDVFTNYVNAYANNTPESEDPMAALEETFVNFRGDTVTLGTAVRYMDQYVNEIRNQLGGANPYEGWPQLNGRTVVDALAEIGQALNLPGYVPPAKAE